MVKYSAHEKDLLLPPRAEDEPEAADEDEHVEDGQGRQQGEEVQLEVLQVGGEGADLAVELGRGVDVLVARGAAGEGDGAVAGVLK